MEANIKKVPNRLYCPACHDRTRSNKPFCGNCGKPMDPNDPVYVTPPVPPTPNPEPVPEPNEGGDFMKNSKFAWAMAIVVVLLLALAVIVTYVVVDSRNTAPDAQVSTAAAANDTTTEVAQNGEHITVFRGETDEETIEFNDSWPGVYPKDDIDWSDNSLHLLGGTYTVQADGVISGDVKVNGKTLYDNDSTTYLVIEVKKGDKVYVNPKWMAWYTNEYSTYLIAQAVQTQFPTWSRQSSKFN